VFEYPFDFNPCCVCVCVCVCVCIFECPAPLPCVRLTNARAEVDRATAGADRLRGKFHFPTLFPFSFFCVSEVLFFQRCFLFRFLCLFESLIFPTLFLFPFPAVVPLACFVLPRLPLSIFVRFLPYASVLPWFRFFNAFSPFHPAFKSGVFQFFVLVWTRFCHF
jgi:hypothetical protein